MNSKKQKIAVILCGGKGLRMGSLTKSKAKPLLMVHGKPIIWYPIKMLENYKFDKLIFPLGYKGENIKRYLLKEFKNYSKKFKFIYTGVNSSVSLRMNKIKDYIPKNEDFLILNSDTIFNFDLNKMLELHRKSKKWITLCSVDLLVKWGLIIFNKKKIIDFDRSRTISNLKIKGQNKNYGLINSGLAILNEKILKYSRKTDYDFESSVYGKVIKLNKAGHLKLKGLWYPIDTDKDLKTINIDKKIIKNFDKNG